MYITKYKILLNVYMRLLISSTNRISSRVIENLTYCPFLFSVSSLVAIRLINDL
jgi:hypothetical protein